LIALYSSFFTTHSSGPPSSDFLIPLLLTSPIRALTFQRVSSWRVDQDVLARVSADSMLVRDVCIAPAPLHLGDLSGNFFAITLRKEEGTNVQNSLSISDQLTASSVLSAFSALAVYPFMNVFGAQRFGSPLPSNPEVGMRLLASDYRGAYVQSSSCATKFGNCCQMNSMNRNQLLSCLTK
jgi:tRNA(Glu) U13 pseudouridine synthase TruD